MTTRTRPTIGTPRDEHEADAAAIERLIATIELGFNSNDAELLVDAFADDASIIDVLGRHRHGHAANLDAARTLLAGPLADEFASYRLDDVTFVHPDVAVARKLAWTASSDGVPLDGEPAMVATYVLVRRDGDWWVAARQNTARAVAA